MITLAVETSTLTASCAVLENGKVLAEISTQHGKTHSQKLIPMLNSMLDMLDRKYTDIDLFAAATGPGSFTGLRIGVVTVKALAYSLKKPVLGIPTLDAMAASVPDFEGVISPMLDARNNQVYTSLYHKWDNRLDMIEPHVGVIIDEWIACLKECKKSVMILGDALAIHAGKIRSALGDKFIEAQQAIFYPRASSVAVLAEKAFNENKAVSPFDLTPCYLRKSQAERLKEGIKEA